MQFFLREIAARLVAAYLLVDSIRTLRLAMSERKINAYSADVVLWLLGWSHQIYRRDTSPVSFWIQFGLQVVLVFASVVVLIFGWHVSNTH